MGNGNLPIPYCPLPIARLLILNDQNLIPSCGLPVGLVCFWCLPSRRKFELMDWLITSILLGTRNVGADHIAKFW